MKKFLTNSKGFTLVELMVVVAIIGILSAIAVPNFKKYQAKSKQSEAKIQLAAVYATEVAANADYDTYATCLIDLGYEQPPKGYYIVGFSADEPTSRGTITTRTGVATSCTNANYAVAPPAGKHLKVDAAALPAATNLPATAVTPTTFDAAAVGDISGSGATYDIWKIDESKALTNTIIGY